MSKKIFKDIRPAGVEHKTLHVLGICGTFMAGIALIARQLGYRVIGYDQTFYPPMSTQLAEQGIECHCGYHELFWDENSEIVIVGNAVRRGFPAFERILNEQLPFISAPEWLSQHVLSKRWVFAIAGTHGKTTTSSLVAWILECAGLNPSFLIGGVVENFSLSARLTDSPYFVIEADEYDTALFDKRSKFLHYHPKTLLLNNLEFDHADIFPSLAAIQEQFHHLLRVLPENGQIIAPDGETNLDIVIAKGVYTPVYRFAICEAEQHSKLLSTAAFLTAVYAESDLQRFKVYQHQQYLGDIVSPLLGKHNIHNVLAAMAMVLQLHVPFSVLQQAISSFKNVRRRLEHYGQINGIDFYDDFAHHPTAIQSTIAGLKAKAPHRRLVVILEMGSYTMRTGFHQNKILEALSQADVTLIVSPKTDFAKSVQLWPQFSAPPLFCLENQTDCLTLLSDTLQAKDLVLVMSNTGFNQILSEIVNLCCKKFASHT